MSIDLSGFEVTHATSRVSRRSGGQQRLNHVAAVLVVAFLLIVPIPLGGNRPAFWAINALMVGGAAALYAMAMLWRREAFRFPLASMPRIVVLWLGFCAYAALQVLIPAETIFAGVNTQVTAGSLSLAPGQSIHSLVQFATFAVFFFLVLQVSANRQRARWIGWAMFSVMVAHALYGLLALTQFGDTLLFLEKWAYFGSATGTFVNRNSYATFMAFGMVLGTALTGQALVQAAETKHAPVAHIMVALVGLAFLLIALYATESRMGLAAGLVGSLVVLVGFVIKLWRSMRRLALLIVGAGVVLAGLGAMLFGSGVLERLGSAEQSFDVRLMLYRQVADMIATRPLLGFGGGSFEVAFPLFHQLPVSPDLVWNKTHSTYLALWTEYGLLFGSIPILVVLAITFRCASLYIKRKTDWLLPLVATGVTVTAGLHSLVDFSLEMEANALFFAALLALGLAGASEYGRNGRAR